MKVFFSLMSSHRSYHPSRSKWACSLREIRKYDRERERGGGRGNSARAGFLVSLVILELEALLKSLMVSGGEVLITQTRRGSRRSRAGLGVEVGQENMSSCASCQAAWHMAGLGQC